MDDPGWKKKQSVKSIIKFEVSYILQDRVLWPRHNSVRDIYRRNEHRLQTLTFDGACSLVLVQNIALLTLAVKGGPIADTNVLTVISPGTAIHTWNKLCYG